MKRTPTANPLDPVSYGPTNPDRVDPARVALLAEHPTNRPTIHVARSVVENLLVSTALTAFLHGHYRRWVSDAFLVFPESEHGAIEFVVELVDEVVEAAAIDPTIDVSRSVVASVASSTLMLALDWSDADRDAAIAAGSTPPPRHVLEACAVLLATALRDVDWGHVVELLRVTGPEAAAAADVKRDTHNL